MGRARGKRRKHKFRYGPVRKLKTVGAIASRMDKKPVQKASVRIDELWSKKDFLNYALRCPLVEVEDISRMMNGRDSISLSEFEEYNRSGERTGKEIDLIVGEGQEQEKEPTSEEPEITNPFPLITMFCRISENLESGMFYLSSQEGNRLQLMRYNGFTFEPYDWSNVSVKSENVVKGCLVEPPEPACAITSYDPMGVFPRFSEV